MQITPLMRYELMAEAFRIMTGHMAPGKDVASANAGHDSLEVRTRLVNCNGCTLCCQGDAILMHPEVGDDPAQYQTEPWDSDPSKLMLAHKANGDCIYLAERGCSIWDRRPAVCRSLDCAELVKSLGYTKCRKLVRNGDLSAAAVAKGWQMLRRKENK